MDSKEAYRNYLQTDTWKTSRIQRLALDNNECVLCGKKASHVHHRRYPKKWGTETVNDLVSLCSECHSKHHNKELSPVEHMVEEIFKDDDDPISNQEINIGLRILSLVRSLIYEQTSENHGLICDLNTRLEKLEVG